MAHEEAYHAAREPEVEWEAAGDTPGEPQVECSDEIEMDEDENCIYCGNKCYNGEMCDEQQAGGFNRE